MWRNGLLNDGHCSTSEMYLCEMVGYYCQPCNVSAGMFCPAGSVRRNTDGAILMDSRYVDVNGEGTNLRSAFGSYPSTSHSSLSSLISHLSSVPPPAFVAIPELERGSVSLSPAQEAAIQKYIAGAGGRLVVLWLPDLTFTITVFISRL